MQSANSEMANGLLMRCSPVCVLIVRNDIPLTDLMILEGNPCLEMIVVFFSLMLLQVCLLTEKFLLTLRKITNYS